MGRGSPIPALVVDAPDERTVPGSRAGDVGVNDAILTHRVHDNTSLAVEIVLIGVVPGLLQSDASAKGDATPIQGPPVSIVSTRPGEMLETHSRWEVARTAWPTSPCATSSYLRSSGSIGSPAASPLVYPSTRARPVAMSNREFDEPYHAEPSQVTW